MTDGTRGAPKGVDNELPDSEKPVKECPYCGEQTRVLPNHLRYYCEMVGDDS